MCKHSIASFSMYLRHIFLLTGMLAAQIAPGQIYVNGSIAGYDRHSNTFLATIPQNQWGKTCQLHITVSDSAHWENTEVNGQSVETPVVIENMLPDKSYPISANIGDSVVSSLLEFTYLPIIFLHGEFGLEDTLGTVVLQQPDTEPEEMLAQIRWRGSTTNQPFKHKRNYKLNFVNKKGEKVKRRFFSLRKDDDWILDAGQADMFRLRNHIAAWLWDDFATKPYYARHDSDIHTSSRGHVVELFLNDEYSGIYNLCEPIDQKQLKVREFDPLTGEIHGGVWKAVGWEGATFEALPPPYDNTLSEWGDFELKYPKIEDLCPSDYSTLYNAIEFVVNASKDEFKEQISNYIDLPVFYDYILFMNVLDAFDLAGKNLYWAVYDKQENKMLTLAVWDLDATMGQSFSHEPPPHPPYVSYDSWPMLPTKIGLQLFIFNHLQFRQSIADRYFNLRKDVFSFANLFGRYQACYDFISGCGATTREERRWSGDSDIEGLKLDFREELAFIYEWLDQRLQHLDRFFSDPVSVRNIPTAPTLDKMVTPFGAPVEPSYHGIVITQGRKYMFNHRQN